MLQFFIFRNQVLIASTHEINIGNTIEFGKCYKVGKLMNIEIIHTLTIAIF